MESDEEDFMSDNFLVAAKQLDEKVRKEKLDRQLYDSKTKKADRLKSDPVFIKPTTISQMMVERLEEGLATKIPKENKGFQLLLKMGYKEGEKLGQSASALAVPLQPELKRDKHGIDYEDK